MPDYNVKNRDIVIVGLQPWDVDLGSNCKNLAIEFSKSNRVLYVNSPLDRKTYWTKSNDPKVKKRINVIRGREKGLRKVDTNIWELYPDSTIESINWIKIPWVFDWLNKRNNLIISNSIRRAVQTLNFEQIILF